MIVALLLLSLSLCGVLYYILNRHKRNPPPLPSPYPIIGYSHFLFTKIEDVWSRLVDATDACNKCGGVGLIKIGPFALCAITDPEVAATILNTCLDKDHIYEFIKPWLGEGLFSGRVPIWKPNRKLIMLSLNQRILDGFLPCFNIEGRRIVEKLASKTNIKELNLHHDMAMLNLRIFLRSQMGQTLEDEEEELEEYLHSLELFHRTMMERMIQPVFHVEPLYQLFGWRHKKKQAKLIDTLNKLPEKIIKNRRALMKENYDNNNLIPEINCKEKTLGKDKIMIDLMLELNEKGVFSNKQLMDEVHTSIFGGHDTSAGTMVFALIMIGAYPEVQWKILEELKQVVPNKDDEVTKAHLTKLVYLEAAIRESMRLYPIMAFIGRIVDRELKFEKYSLYRGTRCIILTHGLARHPVWGPDAEVYRPERWLDPSTLPHGAAFLPFSWGKRNCIGQTYAMMSMKTTISHILRNYKLSASHKKMVIYMFPTVQPKYGHELCLERRTDY